MSGEKASLTPKQRRFVEEYLLDLNATQAAIRAGYSRKTAAMLGYQQLQKTLVADAIASAQARRSQRTEITADWVLQELRKLAASNMGDFMRTGEHGDPHLDFSALTRDQMAALSEVTVDDFTDGRGDDARDVRRVRFKLHDKQAALVNIGRHLGMFTDNLTLRRHPLDGKSHDELRAIEEALAAISASPADAGGDGTGEAGPGQD
jgi:phage terminase small subunit